MHRDSPENCIAIIGSGPSGLMVAGALSQNGIAVRLFEAGPLYRGPDLVGNSAEIVDPLRHAAMALAARRGFGGTSALWGGRTVPLDPIDLERRAWVPNSGWPINWTDLEPWYTPACDFLNCGPDTFSDGTKDADFLRLDALERWCAQPSIGEVKRKEILARIPVEADSVVTRIVFDAERGAATALDVYRDGETRRIPVHAVVVAAGGVETSRLLLASRLETPEMFGGEDGPLGRYYMGHIYGTISDIVFSAREKAQSYDYQCTPTGTYARKRLALSGDIQKQQELMNLTAWPEVPAIADWRHGSAVLSLGYLALASPLPGRLLVAPAIRARKLQGGDGHIGPHVWNVLRGPVEAVQFAATFGTARYLSRVRKPGFFVLNRAQRYEYFYHGEHAPHADSRISLSAGRDAAGMLRARIDLKFYAADAASVVRSHELMAQGLAAAGLARLEYKTSEDDRHADVLRQASDGFHQIGGARMSDNPRTGVVDGHARVHGLSNLFLAGSSIFPTSGQANPTLTAVALAARLAAHLKGAMAAM
jgi:choline dehydrogenase-like flavoprotein